MFPEAPALPGSPPIGSAPALSITELSKSFAGIPVLKSVSFEIAPGEVHALLGQNGSGKSTLIKCLAGVHRPDSGRIQVSGHTLPAAFAPSEARRFGVAFVHQDLGLIDDMTVAENLGIGIGFERSGPLVDWRAQRRRTQEVLETFGLAISPNAVIRDLPVTARTLIAIARAFQKRHEAGLPELACLILDEPTAALPDNDAELLFEAIARVTATGVGVGYVTHRLGEVFRLTTRATVLRDGAVTETLQIEGLGRRDLFTAIVGRSSDETLTVRPPRDERTTATEVLRAEGLTGARVRDASLTVGSGEIVGVAGLAGSGRSELARLLFGAQDAISGVVSIDGRGVPTGDTAAAIKAGVALVPEDRRRDGCVLEMSIAENVTLAQLPTTALGFLDLGAERRAVRRAVEEFDIRPTDPSRTLTTLSGGNQQKVVLAKWLARSPRLLILDEPVQGVDVGAKEDIFGMLRSAAAGGAAVLVIDSDFDNLATLCDRVVVMRAGRIVENLGGDRLTTENMSSSTFGVDDTELVHSAPTKERS